MACLVKVQDPQVQYTGTAAVGAGQTRTRPGPMLCAADPQAMAGDCSRKIPLQGTTALTKNDMQDWHLCVLQAKGCGKCPPLLHGLIWPRVRAADLYTLPGNSSCSLSSL